MYYLLLAFLYPISILPLPVLYLISDFGYLIVYHVMGYRKEIVWDNLKHAFPEKSEEELLLIRKKFYRSFCDQWIETIKLLTISKASLNRRFKGDWELFKKAAAGNRPVYLLIGHFYNWEWGTSTTAMNMPAQFLTVYQPPTNEAFDRIMLKIRTRTGAWMYSMKNLKAAMKNLHGANYVFGLAADQNPAVTEVSEWISFMNREAPFFRGPDQMPRRAKAAVILGSMRKVKRGYYQSTLELVTLDASSMAQGEILHKYVDFLERSLRAQPENYLWSHRRWKHRPPVEPVNR